MHSIKDIFARRYSQQDGLCFVVMPFRPHLDEIYAGVIKPTVETACGMKCVRADEIYSSKSVMGDVWEHIQKADVVVADLTGRNPNVLYELGLCHAIWKRVILLTQSIEEVPFDLAQFRFILYEPSPGGREKLARDLSRSMALIREEEAEDGDDVRRAGMEITRPKEGQSVYGGFPLDGVFKNRPRERDVRAFVASTHDKRIWPQGSVVFDYKSKTWRCEVNLWEQPKSEAYIFVAGLGEDAIILCDYYGAVGGMTHWAPVPNLTSDAVEYARVRVVNGFPGAGGA